MLTLLLCLFMFSANADEVPLPKNELIKQMKNNSDSWWNNVNKDVSCKNINNIYKNQKGYGCRSASGELTTYTPIPDETMESLIDYVSFYGGMAIKSATCSTPVKLLKKADGSLYLQDYASLNVTNVNSLGVNERHKIKAAINDRYKRFLKMYSCDGNKATATTYPNDIVVTPFRMNYAANKAEFDKAFLEDVFAKYPDLSSVETPNDNFVNLSRLKLTKKFFCSNVLERHWECPKTAGEPYACPTLKLSSKFDPDKWVINGKLWLAEGETSEDKEHKENEIALKCIRKSISKGLQVSRITIRTSSDSSDNSSGLCAKDFIGLSRQRSLAIMKRIKTDLKKEGLTQVLSDDQFTLDFYGTNKDGTSGPCANIIKDGIMTDDRDPNVTSDELAKHRSAEAIVSFIYPGQTAGSGTTITARDGSMEILCRDINFSCKTGGVSTGLIPAASLY